MFEAWATSILYKLLIANRGMVCINNQKLFKIQGWPSTQACPGNVLYTSQCIRGTLSIACDKDGAPKSWRNINFCIHILLLNVTVSWFIALSLNISYIFNFAVKVILLVYLFYPKKSPPQLLSHLWVCSFNLRSIYRCGKATCYFKSYGTGTKGICVSSRILAAKWHSSSMQ